MGSVCTAISNFGIVFFFCAAAVVSDELCCTERWIWYSVDHRNFFFYHFLFYYTRFCNQIDIFLFLIQSFVSVFRLHLQNIKSCNSWYRLAAFKIKMSINWWNEDEWSEWFGRHSLSVKCEMAKNVSNEFQAIVRRLHRIVLLKMIISATK